MLVPAALEDQLTAYNAPRIKAKIVLEGANSPPTAEADEVFWAKGMLVIPDIYANAGGVTVSYFEWLKNLSHVRFGRLERRYQATAGRRLLQAIERATGKTFSENDREAFVQAPNELSIVNSGLEDAMTLAYQEIRETLRRQPVIRPSRSCVRPDRNEQTSSWSAFTGEEVSQSSFLGASPNAWWGQRPALS